MICITDQSIIKVARMLIKSQTPKPKENVDNQSGYFFELARNPSKLDNLLSIFLPVLSLIEPPSPSPGLRSLKGDGCFG